MAALSARDEHDVLVPLFQALFKAQNEYGWSSNSCAPGSVSFVVAVLEGRLDLPDIANPLIILEKKREERRKKKSQKEEEAQKTRTKKQQKQNKEAENRPRTSSVALDPHCLHQQ